MMSLKPGKTKPVPNDADILGTLQLNLDILKQGWVYKKSKHLKKYHRRFMVLRGDKLECYKSDRFGKTGESPTETFDLSDHKYRPDKHSSIKFKFYLVDETMNITRTFKTDSSIDCDDWVYIIRDTIVSISKLRQTNIEQIDEKIDKNNGRQGIIHRLATFATLESEMANRMDTNEMHDSSSQESDDDFGGYNYVNTRKLTITSTDIASKSNESNHPQRYRRSTISQRKSNQIITAKSFTNFKIRSLSIDKFGLYHDSDDEQEEQDKDKNSTFVPTMMVFEEETELDDEKYMEQAQNDEEHDDDDDDDWKVSEQLMDMAVLHTDDEDNDNDIASNIDQLIINDFASLKSLRSLKILKKEDDNHKECEIHGLAVSDDDDDVYDIEMEQKGHIVSQLKTFGYDENEIVTAMQEVVNPNNINQIKDKLDEEDDANMQIVIDTKLELLKLDKPETPLIDPDIQKRAKQRKFIEQEIISTEETYTAGLQILLNELIQPIFDNNYVDNKYYDKIRSSLPDISGFHEDFLQKLNVVYLDKEMKQSLSKVFNNCIKYNRDKFIEIYFQFIKDYNGILDLFGSEFHGNQLLQSFLKQKRMERKPLAQFLITPVQRVPRYILLLTDLRKNTEIDSDEYQDINDAVEMITDITREINERKRKIENLSTMLQIQECLNGLREPIINDDREFIEQFIFIKKSIKHQRLFFLFNDILIVANEKWKVKHILDIRSLDIKKYEIKLSTKRRSQLPEFTLISSGAGSVEYVAKDKNDMNKFIKLIGKWRIKALSGEIRERNSSLGGLEDELGRQAKLYD